MLRHGARASALRLLLLVPLALALAACGGSSSLDSGDPFGSAADNTAEAGTQKVRLDSTFVYGFELPNPITVSLRGEGVFDNEAERGTMSTTFEFGSQGPATIDQVFDGAKGWVKLSTYENMLGEGKEWIGIELSDASRQLGADTAAVMGPTPAEVFAQLRLASTDAEEVGVEEIDGVPTTHYRAEVDPSKLSEEQKTGDPLYEPLEMWVDDEGRVRRARIVFAETFPPNREGNRIRVRVEQTVDFSEFGIEANIEPPPPDSVLLATESPGG